MKKPTAIIYFDENTTREQARAIVKELQDELEHGRHILDECEGAGIQDWEVIMTGLEE